MTDARPALSRDELLRKRGAERIVDVLGELPERWLLVSIETQCLYLVEASGSARVYGISTAAKGVDGAEGSFGTPPGVHRIARKIGSTSPPARGSSAASLRTSSGNRATPAATT